MRTTAVIMGAAMLLCAASCGDPTKGSRLLEPLGMPEELGEQSSPAGVIGEGGASPSAPGAPKQSTDRTSPDDNTGPVEKDPPADVPDPFSAYDCAGSISDVCVQQICQVQASFAAAKSSCGDRCAQLESCASAYVECFGSYCQDNEIIDSEELAGCGTAYQTCMYQ